MFGQPLLKQIKICHICFCAQKFIPNFVQQDNFLQEIASIGMDLIDFNSLRFLSGPAGFDDCVILNFQAVIFAENKCITQQHHTCNREIKIYVGQNAILRKD